MAFAGYVILFGVGDHGQAKYITQGLDLKGGVSITYQMCIRDRTLGKTVNLRACDLY